MGFNLKRHLEGSYKGVQDKHMDELIISQAKLAQARYREFSYLSADDEPITLPETINAEIGIDSPESINVA